ncbi:MAG TPA: RHS repeat-associated core domain-containing protein, partial [Pirellulaceae bacterium]|nr:RHS repeat-associated core domain-containing protein [Pirellulaceae bacterium]
YKRVDFDYSKQYDGQYSTVGRFDGPLANDSIGVTTYGFDSRGNLNLVRHQDASNSLVNQYLLTYDANGLLATKSDRYDQAVYTHSADGQLTSVTHTDARLPNETYGYDAMGNRTSTAQQPSGFSTGAGNRLQSDGRFNYSYDSEGNLIRETNIATSEYRVFTWDYRNRLTSVESHSSAGTLIDLVRYQYDVLDRRIVKSVDHTPGDSQAPEVRQYYYDGRQIAIELTISAGAPIGSTPTPDVVYLVGEKVDELIAQQKVGGTTTWTLADQQGTIRDLVDQNGALLDHASLDSFGNILAHTATSVDNRFWFTGREFDGETGLYYYRARYYQPNNGRFISEDSVGFNGGDYNTYRYVRNSPSNANDPSGHFLWLLAGGAFLGGALGALSYTSQFYFPNPSGPAPTWKWSDFWTYTGAGAVSGGLAIATSGAGPVVAGMVAAATNSFIVQAGTKKASEFSWKQLAVETFAGGIGGFVAGRILGNPMTAGLGRNLVAGMMGGAAGGGAGAAGSAYLSGQNWRTEMLRGAFFGGIFGFGGAGLAYRMARIGAQRPSFDGQAPGGGVSEHNHNQQVRADGLGETPHGGAGGPVAAEAGAGPPRPPRGTVVSSGAGDEPFIRGMSADEVVVAAAHDMAGDPAPTGIAPPSEPPSVAAPAAAGERPTMALALRPTEPGPIELAELTHLYGEAHVPQGSTKRPAIKTFEFEGNVR